MSSCGRRSRWRSCPGLFSPWYTAGAHTGNSGCSSTWNTRMLVLAVIVPRHARSTILHSYWSALFSSVSAGYRAAGCLYTCRSTGGLQWTVSLSCLQVPMLKCKRFLSLTSTLCFPPSYLVTNLMGADLNNIVKFQRLSDEHVQFLIYQLLRGLKVITCTTKHLPRAVRNASSMSHEVVDFEIGHILSTNRSLIPGDVHVIKCEPKRCCDKTVAGSRDRCHYNFRSCLFHFFWYLFHFLYQGNNEGLSCFTGFEWEEIQSCGFLKQPSV